jgi:REP element-mobilizing transposase RayT
VQTLETVRLWYDFWLVGYVVMPEHVHLLLSAPESKNLALVLQMLKQMVSRKLQPTPEHSGEKGGPPYREAQGGSEQQPFWQARYYDFNVWSEQKRVEKLRYMHRNPVAGGLVDTSGGLAMEQIPSLSARRTGSGRNRIALDRSQTRKTRDLSYGPPGFSRTLPPFASR